MTPCNEDPKSEKWCCGDSDDCCLSSPITVAAKFNAGKPSSSPTSASTPSSPQTSQPSSGSASSLGGGAIAGIVVGAIAGIALLLSAGFLIMRKRKRAPSSYKAHGHPASEPLTHDNEYYHVQDAKHIPPMAEAPAGQSNTHELA
jgi:predicted lipid-binding transport protein (Tim44 family)